MKTLLRRSAITFSILLSGILVLYSQITADLASFDKIAIGPRINLVLEEGSKEKISVDFKNIDESRINYEVNGKTLRIYLDQAKYVEKYLKTDGGWENSERMYEGVTVKAHVTYQKLKSLKVRGAQTVKVQGPVRSKSFKMDLQGPCDVELQELVCSNFKANVYGDVHLAVLNGVSADQTYRLYGNCEVNCLDFESEFVKATCFGNSKLRIHPSSLRMTAFGNSSVIYTGDPHVSKGLVVGDVSLEKIN